MHNFPIKTVYGWVEVLTLFQVKRRRICGFIEKKRAFYSRFGKWFPKLFAKSFEWIKIGNGYQFSTLSSLLFTISLHGTCEWNSKSLPLFPRERGASEKVQ